MKIEPEAFAAWKQAIPLPLVLARLGCGEKSGRYFCPLCQPSGASHHRSPDLAVYERALHCFKCGFHGDIISLVQQKMSLTLKDALAWLGFQGGQQKAGSFRHPSIREPVSTASRRPPRGGVGDDIAPALRAEREALWQSFEKELRPGSLGAQYLAKRGIPLDLALEYGVGFAPWPTWPIRSFAREEGHVVFPHTTANGILVNLYARSIEVETGCPKEKRHSHLPGPKGYFNGGSLKKKRVILAEGAFDALSLIQLGNEHVVGVFGIESPLAELVNAEEVIFAFDNDAAGSRWKLAATALLSVGVKISTLADELGKEEKDFNEKILKTGVRSH